ncbi:thiamine pyrophosphate-binding protein [Porticoccus sp.]
MKKSGAWLTCYALEQIGVSRVFGIPGAHTAQIYQELEHFPSITPHLVTHEVAAAFMADAISRTTEHIGTLLVVPGAGITHAASGIGEAFLAGVPLLVIAGGIERNPKHHFQVQDIDHQALLKPITKATYLVERVTDIVPTLYEAYRTAVEGEPGPVFVEIPVQLQSVAVEQGSVSFFHGHPVLPPLDMASIEAAAQMLLNAKRPGLLVGWGARYASEALQALSSRLGAPVATTLQGLSVFPANHPLHTGMGFGPSAVPAAQHAFADCDCLLAIATRFSEIATGHYGMNPPANLIHADINPRVFNANYPAALTLQGDATAIAVALLEKVTELKPQPADSTLLANRIAFDKQDYRNSWLKLHGTRVNPARFFAALRKRLPEDALLACDEGNHTFLAAELFPLYSGGVFISPSDFNAMGYCVPATNALKLAHPTRTTVGIVGDGTMMMSGMEAITASKYQLGVVYCLFNDGQLSQPGQQRPYRRGAMTKLGEADWISFAHAVGCEYVAIEDNQEIDAGLDTALTLASRHQPVLLDVHIDYSRRSAFSEGLLKTRQKQFGRSPRAGWLARTLKEKIMG